MISEPATTVPVVTDAFVLEALQRRLNVASCNVIVDPTQSEVGPVITAGGEPTLIGTVIEQPIGST